VHFEDFSSRNSYRLLAKYRKQVLHLWHYCGIDACAAINIRLPLDSIPLAQLAISIMPPLPAQQPCEPNILGPLDWRIKTQIL
jgi:hypothetical protein